MMYVSRQSETWWRCETQPLYSNQTEFEGGLCTLKENDTKIIMVMIPVSN
jgi:hypothetical protein